MTKRKIFKASGFAAVIAAAGALVSGCSLINPNPTSLLANSANSSSQNTYGQIQPGISSSVPTADEAVGRIQKGLTLPGASASLVNPASGNFKKVLAQIETNLPYSTDPTKATGLEQIPLLIYAACSDVNPGSYNVNVNQSLSSNMTPLVNAGVAMVNQHVGGIASTGTSLNQQVSAVFTELVNADLSSGASTSTAFISVCLAANSFGVGMMGF